MTLLLAMLLFAQDAPDVQARSFSVPARPFEFEPAVAPAVALYLNCLAGELGDLSTNIAAAFEASIVRCADARENAIRRADELLRDEPGWSDPQRRRRSIETTFSEIDASHRDQADRLLEVVGTGRGQRDVGKGVKQQADEDAPN